jgi:glycosyltransferase involved in cell wall biosynthesis
MEAEVNGSGANPIVNVSPSVSNTVVNPVMVEAKPVAKLPAVEAKPVAKLPAVEAKPEAKLPAVEAKPVAKPENRLRLLIVGTHLQQTTGYAKVMHGMIHALSAIPWIDLTHFAIQRPQPPTNLKRDYPPNVRVIDAMQLETERRPSDVARMIPPGFAFAHLPQAIRDTAPHIVLVYNDVMIIQEYIQEIRKAQLPRKFALWLYLDVVYPYMSTVFTDMMNREVDRIFCFTKGWREVLQQQGITRPIDVLPHAFEATMFQPIAKQVAREAANIPRDAFLILSTNRNQPRKRLDLLVMAFTELIVKHPEKPIYLMCVCGAGQGQDAGGSSGGYALFDIFARELALRNAPVDQFGGRLLITNTNATHSDEHINIMYNMADCGVSCAEGEGFGLCAFEQMGVGVPQILSDVIGHREYCEHERNGLIVPVSVRTYLPTGYYPIGGEAGIVDYRAVAGAIEKYVIDEQLRVHHGKTARDVVLGYTWERVLRTFIRRLRSTYDDAFEGSE